MTISEKGTMEERLATLGRSVDRLIEEIRGVKREDVQPRLEEEVAVWKQMLDEARVQAELGRMEARDRFEPLFGQLETISSELEHRFDDLRRTKEWDELEGSLRESLTSLRRDIATSEEFEQ